jgi:hypothetical protein
MLLNAMPFWNQQIPTYPGNQAGKNTGESGAESFGQVHEQVKTPFNNTLGKSDIVDKESPTERWIFQMAYKAKIYCDPSGKLVSFTNVLYTCLTLAKDLQGITDYEARWIGTVQRTKIDSTNCRFLSEEMAMMKDTVRLTRFSI